MSTRIPTIRRRIPAALRRNTAKVAAVTLAASGAFAVAALSAHAATSNAFVSGVTFPFNGVWLESKDGGHLWDASAAYLRPGRRWWQGAYRAGQWNCARRPEHRRFLLRFGRQFQEFLGRPGAL